MTDYPGSTPRNLCASSREMACRTAFANGALHLGVQSGRTEGDGLPLTAIGKCL
jgi:hypothetical protein